ncbi:helix-turn-helix transcriptional regulator [Deminuibacter soli]|uniref:AraC family transcriptional regulator n=1 Tax=Deminuibacter soli TaxID=2291815 RepID=A0A3E1NJW9_9BACT|nr:helix-turn-helix transcriptional regulator [Deminuibacter soli]RFM28222.1 AraC family transcriptional regulator [Deminuibacter soli]
MNIFKNSHQGMDTGLPPQLKTGIIPWANQKFTIYPSGQLLLQEYSHSKFTFQWYNYRMNEDTVMHYAPFHSYYLLLYTTLGQMCFSSREQNATRIALPEKSLLLLKVPVSGIELVLPAGKHEMVMYVLRGDFSQELSSPGSDFHEIFRQSKNTELTIGSFVLAANYMVQDIVKNILQHDNNNLGIDLLISLLTILKQYKKTWFDIHMQQPAIYVSQKEKLVEIRKKIIADPNRGNHKLTQLSRQYNIPEKKLRTEFRLLFHTELTDFVMEQMMERVKYLLRHSNKSIDSIALELGYENGANLAKTFRKHTQLSPREYRLQQSVPKNAK